MIESLEKRFGKLAVPGLMRYIVGLNALVYLLYLIAPGYLDMLTLDRAAVLQGEVWRLVSWIFVPNTTGVFWIFFFLMFTWWLGEILEGMWGTFRLNLYYFVGYLASTLSAFIFGASGGNFLLILTLLLAVATLQPNLQVLLLIIPVKIKWIALVSLAFPWGLLFVTGTLAMKAMILVSLGNYLVFFGPAFLRTLREKGENEARRRKFRALDDPEETLHRCCVCGITEVSNPDAVFLVAPDGKEYCTDHIHLAKRDGGES